MQKTYSLVIHPSDEILGLVKSMKEQLAAEVGWFNSKNSVGHITICEFKTTEKGLENIKTQIKKICSTLSLVNVHLNEFGSFPNGAFFIAPDNDSKKSLKRIMKQFHISLLLPDMLKSDNPHLTIARRLKPENLVKANQMFTIIDLNFVCDSVVLREFDEKVKQFFVIDTFEFGNNPQPKLIQGTLF